MSRDRLADEAAHHGRDEQGRGGSERLVRRVSAAPICRGCIARGRAYFLGVIGRATGVACGQVLLNDFSMRRWMGHRRLPAARYH